MTMEYNKIHALAQARSKVFDAFGSDLMNFWPMADNSQFIRDLLRKKPIFGSGVTMQAPGFIDYGVDVQAGNISDVVPDQGAHTFPVTETISREGTDYRLAVPIPAGRWKGLTFRNSATSNLSPGVVVAPANTDPANVVADKVFQANSVKKAISFNAASNTADWILQALGTTKAGQKVTLDGDLWKATFRMRRQGFPGGTIYCRVYDSSGSLMATADTTYLANNLSTADSTYTFTFNTPVAITNEEVKVIVEFSGGGGSLMVLVNKGSDQDSGIGTYYNGSWNDDGSYDMYGTLQGIEPIHTVTFPFELDAAAGQYWAYFKASSDYLTSGTYGTNGKKWNATTSVWDDQTRVLCSFQGADAVSWAATDKLTVGVVVNLDNSEADGMLLALADATEAKVSIRINTAKKVDGIVKNTNGDSKTVSHTTMLHPGHNLITLSYEKNVAVKLGINGVVVDTQVPTNYGLLNATMALGLGALVKSDKSVSDQLADALVDDVWIAKNVVTDTVLWDIYKSYITAAPLMLTKAV